MNLISMLNLAEEMQDKTVSVSFLDPECADILLEIMACLAATVSLGAPDIVS